MNSNKWDALGPELVVQAYGIDRVCGRPAPWIRPLDSAISAQRLIGSRGLGQWHLLLWWIISDGSVDEMSSSCGFDTRYKCGYQTSTSFFPYIEPGSAEAHHWLRRGSAVSKHATEFANILFDGKSCYSMGITLSARLIKCVTLDLCGHGYCMLTPWRIILKMW